MKLVEQRDRLTVGVACARMSLQCLQSAILRKMNSPYGDGSRSNMVNAETDVLPQLSAILEMLRDAAEGIGSAHTVPVVQESDSVRIW